jgi:hypothetical protein
MTSSGLYAAGPMAFSARQNTACKLSEKPLFYEREKARNQKVIINFLDLFITNLTAVLKAPRMPASKYNNK